MPGRGGGWSEEVGGRVCRAPTCGQHEVGEAQEEDGPDSQGGEARSCHREGSAGRTQGHGEGAGSWHAGSFLSDSRASWVYMLLASHTEELGSHRTWV